MPKYITGFYDIKNYRGAGESGSYGDSLFSGLRDFK